MILCKRKISIPRRGVLKLRRQIKKQVLTREREPDFLWNLFSGWSVLTLITKTQKDSKLTLSTRSVSALKRHKDQTTQGVLSLLWHAVNPGINTHECACRATTCQTVQSSTMTLNTKHIISGKTMIWSQKTITLRGSRCDCARIH